MSDQIENVDDDPVAQLQGEIATLLSELSDASDTPTEFDQGGSPFSPEDFDFRGDWVSRLVELQGWLRFDEQLPQDDLGAFVHKLGSLLGFADPGVVIHNSHELNEVGLERLRDRVEQANRLRSVFVEALEDDAGTRASATSAWIAAWENEDVESADDDAPAEPVSAKADIWRVSDFIGKAGRNQLNLAPSYQRGDVWVTRARQLLIESILRGIPLPSIILLRPERSQLYEVVDGKQRLTSILRFVGKHPVAIAEVKRRANSDAAKQHPDIDLMRLFEEDYPKFKRAWKGVFGEPVKADIEAKYFFPFKLRSDERIFAGEHLEPLRGKYYTQIRTNSINVAGSPTSVQEVFEEASDYKIPIIEYTSATQRQIHEVFNLYNKQGTHLNAEEIRNAIFHDLELTRAILATAGDAGDDANIEGMAPSLAGHWDSLCHVQESLNGYQFGVGRYKRFKVLAWIIATLLGEKPVGKNLPSTAKHIDNLLRRVQSNPADPLRDPQNLVNLFSWIARSIEMHASRADELFDASFRNGGTGAKWQELQLVGSLVGIAFAAAALPDDIESRLDEHTDDIFQASKSAQWRRPEKTQTKTQWEYVGRVAHSILDLLEIDARAVADTLTESYGSSGVDSVLLVAGHDDLG